MIPSVVQAAPCGAVDTLGYAIVANFNRYAKAYVTEWRRFPLALFRLNLVKQIFNYQTSKVQLFTEFITDILYVHDVSSL